MADSSNVGAWNTHWMNPLFSDLTLELVVKGAPSKALSLPVHRLILSQFSAYFNSRLTQKHEFQDHGPFTAGSGACMTDHAGKRARGHALPESMSPAVTLTPDPSRLCLIEHCNTAEEQAAAVAALKHVYTGALPSISSVQDVISLEQVCLKSNYWCMPATVTACLSAFSTAAAAAASVEMRTAFIQLASTLPEQLLTSSNAGQGLQQNLCKLAAIHFGNALDIMCDKQLQQQFTALPFELVKHWAGLDDLVTDSENTVAVLLTLWVARNSIQKAAASSHPAAAPTAAMQAPVQASSGIPHEATVRLQQVLQQEGANGILPAGVSREKWLEMCSAAQKVILDNWNSMATATQAAPVGAVRSSVVRDDSRGSTSDTNFFPQTNDFTRRLLALLNRFFAKPTSPPSGSLPSFTPQSAHSIPAVASLDLPQGQAEQLSTMIRVQQLSVPFHSHALPKLTWFKAAAAGLPAEHLLVRLGHEHISNEPYNADDASAFGWAKPRCLAPSGPATLDWRISLAELRDQWPKADLYTFSGPSMYHAGYTFQASAELSQDSTNHKRLGVFLRCSYCSELAPWCSGPGCATVSMTVDAASGTTLHQVSTLNVFMTPRGGIGVGNVLSQALPAADGLQQLAAYTELPIKITIQLV